MYRESRAKANRTLENTNAAMIKAKWRAVEQVSRNEWRPSNEHDAPKRSSVGGGSAHSRCTSLFTQWNWANCHCRSLSSLSRSTVRERVIPHLNDPILPLRPICQVRLHTPNSFFMLTNNDKAVCARCILSFQPFILRARRAPSCRFMWITNPAGRLWDFYMEFLHFTGKLVKTA